MTRVVVAGAGIAGLTAALALADAGVEVEVIDAATTLSEAGAGVQLSPNATRILRELGLLNAMAARAVRPTAVHIRRARDGADLAQVPLGPAAEQRYGAPFLVAHRADLQAVLLDAAKDRRAITLSTGSRLQDVARQPDGLAVTVERSTGTDTILADGLVGADGLRSAVRRFVAPEAPAPHFSGRTAWRTLIPSETAPAFARAPASTLWLGSGAHLVHYPVRGGALINVVAVVQDGPGRAAPDDWVTPGDPARLQPAFAAWCREARALIDAAPDWRVWPLYELAALPRCTRDGVALSGDAAHPMLPFLAQGAAQAIEDGGALGASMRQATSFAAAATAYAQARKAQADRVVAQSRRQGAIYHLAGPAAFARDTVFRVLGSKGMLARVDWLYGRVPYGGHLTQR